MFDARWAEDPRDRDDDPRERDEDSGRHLGRGSSSRDDPERGAIYDRERSADPRERHRDPRDALLEHVHLPRGLERELVLDARGHEYDLRGSESRTLSAVGAFRVVRASDLRDFDDRAGDPRRGDLRHLREEGLIDTLRLDGRHDVAVVLTDRGRELLEHHRDRDDERCQAFYSGILRARELEHDSQLYAAYEKLAEDLLDRRLQHRRAARHRGSELGSVPWSDQMHNDQPARRFAPKNHVV